MRSSEIVGSFVMLLLVLFAGLGMGTLIGISIATPNQQPRTPSVEMYFGVIPTNATLYGILWNSVSFAPLNASDCPLPSRRNDSVILHVFIHASLGEDEHTNLTVTFHSFAHAYGCNDTLIIERVLCYSFQISTYGGYDVNTFNVFSDTDITYTSNDYSYLYFFMYGSWVSNLQAWMTPNITVQVSPVWLETTTAPEVSP